MADAPTDFAPADFAMPGEVSAPGASSADDYVAEYRSAARTDWEVMAQGLKQRQKANDADKKKGSKDPKRSERRYKALINSFSQLCFAGEAAFTARDLVLK